MVFLWGGLAIVVAIISYLRLRGQQSGPSSRKARQAKAMKDAFNSINNSSKSAPVPASKDIKKDENSLQITQLFIYPIKSIRGCSVPSAILTKEGFYLDRRFMLLKDNRAATTTTSSKDSKPKPALENMHVTSFPQMCLFHTAINDNMLEVTYHPPNSSHLDARTLDICYIPLDPDPDTFNQLEKVDVEMHGSPTTAFNMGSQYNAFFTQHFNFPVILAFWGLNPRPVLGNLPGKPATAGPKTRNTLTKIAASLPVIGNWVEGEEENSKIAFNDCAPYLVITTPSLHNASSRLPSSVEVDPTKFRANIILDTSEPAWAEDYWSELTFHGPDSAGAKILLTGNCGRCASLNVDYETGKSGTGPDGAVLKSLMGDRRVDGGMKWSPIFGRYGFVGGGGEGKVVRVGDWVGVTGRNEGRTRFYWPGLST